MFLEARGTRYLPIVGERRLFIPSFDRILFASLVICQFWGHGYAQCESVDGSTAPLYWDANSEPNIDHYNVYRSPTSGSGYSVIGTAPQSPDPVSLTDPTPLSTGYYVVTAVDTSGLESGFSQELCVSMEVALPPPPPPPPPASTSAQ